MKLMTYIIFFLFLSSCKHKNQEEAINLTTTIKEISTPHPKFKHFIEINSVPKPFDVDGAHPYVLWINGKKMNTFKIKHKLVEIVNSFEEKEIEKPPTPDIHKGWLTSNLFTQESDLHEILLKNARSTQSK